MRWLDYVPDWFACMGLIFGAMWLLTQVCDGLLGLYCVYQRHRLRKARAEVAALLDRGDA